MAKLLAAGITNAKTAKSEAIQGNFTTSILYMLPNPKICPHATGCMRVCLQSAGMGNFSNVREARRRKRQLYLTDRKEFYRQLERDVRNAEKLAAKKGKRASVRLNGTSDIDHMEFIAKFPNVQFYDYTKDILRAYKLNELNLPNYHLTISRTEFNEGIAFNALRAGIANVAVVFRKELPKTYKGFEVIDGTTHDLRFLDKRKVIVGLSALGKAKKDTSGFVVDCLEVTNAS